MPLTFAYGSNLDPQQIASRCPGARDRGMATLEAHELWFGGPSRLRGGGVLGLREGSGRVRGRLWELDPPGLASLDRFEGHPHFYRRELLEVGTDEGPREAWVYRLRTDCFELLPRAAYLEQVRAAWRALQLDLEPLEVAAGRGAFAVIFVYGTLRQGFQNAHYLEASSYLGTALTEQAWRLSVQGGYPAIRPGSEAIHGELYEVDETTLARIDELERHPDLYVRQVIRLREGRPVEAYVYRGG